MNDNVVGGIIGASLSVSGLAVAPNEVLQTISLVLTILGAIVSFIVVPLLNWHREAKKDGKITAEEVAEGLETLKDGVEKVEETTRKDKK